MSIIQTEEYEIIPRGNKIIRLDYDKSLHNHFLNNKSDFKTFLDEQISKYPELFPTEISAGYSLHGTGRASKKLDNLKFQKIRINNTGDYIGIGAKVRTNFSE